jgi:hypothetical protein
MSDANMIILDQYNRSASRSEPRDAQLLVAALRRAGSVILCSRSMTDPDRSA